MSSSLPTSITVAIVDEVSIRAQRLSQELSRHPRFGTPTLFGDLSEAFVSIEVAPPDLVLVSPGLAARKEYPMLDALLDMLKIRRLFLLRHVDRNRPSTAQSPLRSDAEIADFARSLYRLLGLAEQRKSNPQSRPDSDRIIVMGSSTGGIEALLAILPHFPKNCPPTFIVQHIKADFLPALVRRLDSHCAADVREATGNEIATPGRILVAPGNEAHMVLRPNGRRCVLQSDPPETGHRPSVDRLFRSAVPYGEDVIAVLLTGMGRDGAAGMAEIRRAGGWTIAQDEATSVVYGMPQAAKRMGGVCEELPLDRIGPAIFEKAGHDLVKSA